MRRSLRILMFAHHHAGVAALHALRQAGHEIIGCFTHPTREAWIPSMQDACAALGVPVSTDAPAVQLAAGYRSDRPDLVLSVYYRQRVPLPFLALARWAPINVHPSPLPRYRGPNPIRWAILNDERAWGVTVHAMGHAFNDGGVLLRHPVMIFPYDNAYDLYMRCAAAAARAALDAVTEIASGAGNLVAQGLREMSFYATGIPNRGRIDWSQPAATLESFVRAMDFGRGDADGDYEHLAAPATASIAGETLGIWRTAAGGTASAYPPGSLTRCDDEVWVQTGRGHLAIERVRDAAGRDYPAADYFAHRGFAAGDTFDLDHLWSTAAAAESQSLAA